MYIWILLATIMMMFSFYNLAPRADKEDSMVEVKAATVVNRFRAESAAFMKAFECQAIMGVDTGNTEWMNNEYVFSEGDADYGYTKYSENLPVGYAGNNNLEVKHTVVCLDKPINDPEVSTTGCSASTDGEPIYMISFAKIPEQWLSKTDMANGVQPPHPTPELIHYISDANNGGITYGWIECKAEEEAGFGCQLNGYHARFADVEDTGERDENGLIIQKRTYKQIEKNSHFWQIVPELQATCGAEEDLVPCLFAFHRVPYVDFKGACSKAVCESREGYEPPLDKCEGSDE